MTHFAWTKRTGTFIFVLLCSAVIGGCATISTGSHYDETTNFGEYQTFSWVSDTPYIYGGGDPRISPLTQSKIQSAIRDQLQQKGYRYVADNQDADFAVAYTVGTRQEVRVDSYPAGYRGSWGWHVRGSYYSVSTASTAIRKAHWASTYSTTPARNPSGTAGLKKPLSTPTARIPTMQLATAWPRCSNPFRLKCVFPVFCPIALTCYTFFLKQFSRRKRGDTAWPTKHWHYLSLPWYLSRQVARVLQHRPPALDYRMATRRTAVSYSWPCSATNAIRSPGRTSPRSRMPTLPMSSSVARFHE